MSDFAEKLDAQIKLVVERFNALKAEREKLVAQLNAVAEEQMRLQGEHRALLALKKDDTPEPSSLVAN